MTVTYPARSQTCAQDTWSAQPTRGITICGIAAKTVDEDLSAKETCDNAPAATRPLVLRYLGREDSRLVGEFGKR